MITFQLHNATLELSTTSLKRWLNQVALSENKTIAHVNYTFCDDAFLIEINRKFLNHDTFTDIITFDNCQGNFLNGDIYISTERIMENSTALHTDYQNELLRVIAHGILHLSGYKDKSADEASLMRQKEEEKIQLFHVEQ